MQSIKNKVQLIGHVGATPEIRINEINQKQARLSIAIDQIFRNSRGEKVKETQWFNLVAWNKTADIIEKIVFKGDEIAVEGRLSNRQYLTNTGEKRHVCEVEVNELIILKSKNYAQRTSTENSK